VDVSVIGHHETQSQEQAAAVEKMLSKEWMPICPMNEYTLSPVAQQALDRGIPVIPRSQMAGVRRQPMWARYLGGRRVAAAFIAERLGGTAGRMISSDMFTARQRRQGSRRDGSVLSGISVCVPRPHLRL